VLQVGIHNRNAAALADTLDAGAREAAPANAGECNARGRPIHPPRDCGGPVRRIIIHKQNFPLAAGEDVLDPLEENGNIRSFIVRWNDDAKLRHRQRSLTRSARGGLPNSHFFNIIHGMSYKG